MKQSALFFCVALLLCSLASCDRLFKPKPEEIFAEQKSGVVLICNQFYYDVTLSNGEHIYFTGVDDDGELQGATGQIDEVQAQPAILNGTGFFIDGSGRILTNRHVVAPEVDKKTVRDNVNTIISLGAAYLEMLQDSIAQVKQSIEEYAGSTLYYDDYGQISTTLDDDELQQLNAEYESLEQEYNERQAQKENIESLLLDEDFTIELHSQFGIAYDGDNINSWADFMKKPCTLQRVSGDSGTDLALLQLNTKITPKGHYIYDLGNADDYSTQQLEINQPLYMIGYNYGVALAATTKGIGAQFTSGTLTQQPDGNRVTYSIPAKEGSSGSPVVDDRGRLVAVNFAGSNGSDNFNFGIPMLRVLTFAK